MKRTEAQQAAIDNRGGGLLVAAAAGSGKTSVLVERLLNRVEFEGLAVSDFLIITFTRASAAELRGRIASELKIRMKNAPQNQHLKRQVNKLYSTQISTIHGFCTTLLRQWAYTLDIPSDFSLCDETKAKLLMRNTVDKLLSDSYEALDMEGAFPQLLDLFSSGRDDEKLGEIILDVFSKVQSHPQADAWLLDEKKRFLETDGDNIDESPWVRYLLEDAKRKTSYWLSTFDALCDDVAEEASLAPYLPSLLDTQASLQEFYLALDGDWDDVGDFSITFDRLKSVRNCDDPQLQERVKAIRNACKSSMGKVEILFSHFTADMLDDLDLIAPSMVCLLDMVSAFSKRYTIEKQKRRILDFGDLEQLTVRLLWDEKGEKTPAALEISKRYQEIMVDEYQDTNEVQNAIFRGVSRNMENLFMVGDVKQSIYRFRLADPTIFLGKYNSFTHYENAKLGEDRKLLLSQNFRSRPEVLDAVNFVFSNIMSPSLGEMSYGEEEKLISGGLYEPDKSYAPVLHVLDKKAMKEKGSDGPQMEAIFVAKEIGKLLRTGFLIADGKGGKRPICPSDIAILLRSPGSSREYYLKALKEENIPLIAESGGGFFQHMEVELALSFLRIIDNPRQDVPLLAVLHSPLYGFTGEDLADIRKEPGDFYEALQKACDTKEKAAQFLRELEEFRFRSRELSCDKLLWLVYEKSYLLDLVGDMPRGSERREHLMGLYHLATQFCQGGEATLFDFLGYVDSLIAMEKSPPMAEQSGGEGVKLLSIHRSKGLEYPVVFLAGLGKLFNLRDLQKPVLFHPKEGLGAMGVDAKRMVSFHSISHKSLALRLKKELLAEEMRLLYVAMTRAKDKLIMTTTLPHGISSIGKLSQFISTPVPPVILENCASMGQWLLLLAMARPEGKKLCELADVYPMALPPQDFPWEIHYHDSLSGSRPKLSKTLLIKEALREKPDFSNLHWQYPHSYLAGIGAKITVTALNDEAKGDTLYNIDEVEEDGTEKETGFRQRLFQKPRFLQGERPLSPAERGTALHTLLSAISFDKCQSLSDIESEIQRLVAQQFLSPKEGSVIKAQDALNFFTSPLGLRLLTAQHHRREFPFTILVEGDRVDKRLPKEEKLLLQGVIDCFFEEEDGLVLIDFKSNRFAPKDMETVALGYKTQMESYEKALSSIFGKKVKESYLWFLHLGEAFSL